MFIESPRFPDDVSLGVTGGPEFNTSVASNPGGFLIANRERLYPLHKYQAEHGVRTLAQFKLLQNLFWIVAGKYGGFRFKDWLDYQLDVTSSVLTAVSPGVYQLGKTYAFGGQSLVRRIVKPVPGTVLTYQSGTIIAGTVDTSTGLVTMAATASATISGITVGTTTTISIAASLGSPTSVALAGLTGPDAAFLNGQTFPVTTASDSSLVLSVNTTGKTIGTSTATSLASVYPDPSTLSASAEFDVPTKFDTDVMQASAPQKAANGTLLYSWGQIPLVEWRNPA